jgi:hypothetical protein
LPTTLSSSLRGKTESHGYDAETELVDLLSELRERLDNRKETVKTSYRTLFDNVNEERRHTADQVKSNTDNYDEWFSFDGWEDSTLTSVQQQRLVDEINNKRRDRRASDMYKIHWNSNLAKMAQFWSSKCQFKHGNPVFEASALGFNRVGTNIWGSEGPFDVTAIVKQWNDQRANFSMTTQNCLPDTVCGSYKQLVTSFTTEVGCGLSFCPRLDYLSNAQFVVCYFAPPGNYYEERTFTLGAPCTACKYGQFYCNDNLCDNTCTSPGADCECKADCHCGKETPDCRCICPAGSSGVHCGNPCDDDKACKGLRPQWGPGHCNENFPFVSEICPKMCNKCTAGKGCQNEINAWENSHASDSHHNIAYDFS